MKEQILKLRAEGKSYKEIKKLLGCSSGTIAYHCGEGQKEKTRNREYSRRKETVIRKKCEHFQYDRRVKDKADDFQRERFFNEKGQSRLGKRTITFSWRDVIEKFGWETTCYLTGRKINMREPLNYQFDHIVAYSKNGSCGIDNLGIACRDANQAKHDMSVDDFITLCKDVLEHNGYDVNKKTGRELQVAMLTPLEAGQPGQTGL